MSMTDELSAEWTAVVGSWAEQLRGKGKAPATIDGYAQHLGWLSRDLGGSFPDPWSVTSKALTEWLGDHAWSAHTRRKVLVSIRGFYTWGVLDGRCQRSPMAGIPTVPPRKRGPARLTVPELWEEPLAAFLTALAASARQPGTLEQRRWWVTRLAETYADPWAVTTPDLALWLSRDDWAPATKRLAVSSVRTFYRWAERTGYVEKSPAADLDPVRVRRSQPRPATDDAVRHALDHADERIRLAILLASYAGLRRAEIANLHTLDIGEDSLLVHGKGGHERSVPLHPVLARALRVELRRRVDGGEAPGWGPEPERVDGWLFPSSHGGPLTPAHLGKLVRESLPDGWTTHTLRHRFATQAYRVGRDLRAVQELLGHTKPETTARYAAVPDGAILAAVAGVGL